MTTEMQRITVNLSDEDYQWVAKQAELSGNSRAGIVRQMVRALRLGRPGLLNLGGGEMAFSEEANLTGQEAEENDQSQEESEEAGLEAFSSE